MLLFIFEVVMHNMRSWYEKLAISHVSLMFCLRVGLWLAWYVLNVTSSFPWIILPPPSSLAAVFVGPFIELEGVPLFLSIGVSEAAWYLSSSCIWAIQINSAQVTYSCILGK